jgi:hypothetical protein
MTHPALPRCANAEANSALRIAVENALDTCIADGQPFTADDVRKLLPVGVQGGTNVLPSVIGIAAGRRRITAVDSAVSARRSRHSSRLRVWVGVAA